MGRSIFSRALSLRRAARPDDLGTTAPDAAFDEEGVLRALEAALADQGGEPLSDVEAVQADGDAAALRQAQCGTLVPASELYGPPHVPLVARIFQSIRAGEPLDDDEGEPADPSALVPVADALEAAWVARA